MAARARKISAVQPCDVPRYEAHRGHGRARASRNLHLPRRAPEPHDADGDATLHAPDQRLLEKFTNHGAAVALHFLHYNFARPHSSLEGATPAQAAGVSRYRWSCEEIAGLLDDAQYADALKVQMRPRREFAAS